MYTNTNNGYCVDATGRKHFSIHPRVYDRTAKVNTAAIPKRTKGRLAKALKVRNARRNANGTHNSGSKFADHMAGSMKWK